VVVRGGGWVGGGGQGMPIPFVRFFSPPPSAREKPFPLPRLLMKTLSFRLNQIRASPFPLFPSEREDFFLGVTWDSSFGFLLSSRVLVSPPPQNSPLFTGSARVSLPSFFFPFTPAPFFFFPLFPLDPPKSRPQAPCLLWSFQLDVPPISVAILPERIFLFGPVFRQRTCFFYSNFPPSPGILWTSFTPS